MYWNENTEKWGNENGRLNSNIRCIEMIRKVYRMMHSLSWIVTLDVLKYKRDMLFIPLILLNSNIRCIEIRKGWENRNKRRVE